MDRSVPISYRDFWDVPRIFIAVYKGYRFLFDCPFDGEEEDFGEEYRVYLLPELDAETLSGSWANLAQQADRYIENISIDRVQFDASKRKEIDAELLDQLIARHLQSNKVVV